MLISHPLNPLLISGKGYPRIYPLSQVLVTIGNYKKHQPPPPLPAFLGKSARDYGQKFPRKWEHACGPLIMLMHSSRGPGLWAHSFLRSGLGYLARISGLNNSAWKVQASFKAILMKRARIFLKFRIFIKYFAKYYYYYYYYLFISANQEYSKRIEYNIIQRNNVHNKA